MEFILPLVMLILLYAMLYYESEGEWLKYLFLTLVISHIIVMLLSVSYLPAIQQQKLITVINNTTTIELVEYTGSGVNDVVNVYSKLAYVLAMVFFMLTAIFILKVIKQYLMVMLKGRWRRDEAKLLNEDI